MPMLSTLTTSGHQINIHILGNEASYISNHCLLKNNIKYQLVPPHLHRRNADEHTIQTFKAHFITCIYTADPDYPDKERDSLLPQATLTLNLPLNCNFNPKLSAYADLHGIFDYNKKSLTPLETIVLVHDNTTNSCTWAPHGTDGWYIGPNLEHY